MTYIFPHPYLGKNNVNGQDIVVLFTDADCGVIVMSQSEQDDKFAFGKYYENFAEEQYEVLPPNLQVSLSN